MLESFYQLRFSIYPPSLEFNLMLGPVSDILFHTDFSSTATG